MSTVFADAYYFLALLNRNDQAHAKAVSFTAGFAGRIITTPWVLVEVADAVAATPQGRAEFIATLTDLRNDSDAFVVPGTEALFEDGVRLYDQRPDKKWSLTDCLSFVVMNQNGIHEALTADHHFEQAGFVTLLK